MADGVWIPVRASAKGFISDVVKAASGAGKRGADQLASEMETGGRQAGQRAGQATAAGLAAQRGAIERVSAQLAAARDAEADAAGAVRVAEERLAEIRQNAGSTASQVARAEEQLATAKNRQETASGQAARADADLDRIRAGSEATARAVIRAEDQLQTAKNNAAKAAGDVRVADLRLQEVRENSSSTASQIAAAEERVETARRRSEAATDQVKSREMLLTAARADAASSAERSASASDQAAGGAKRAGDAMSQADTDARGFGSSLADSAKKAGTAALAFAGIAGVGSIFKSGFDRLMDIERAEIMFKNIGMSAQETEAHMGRLTEQVTGTSVSLSDAAKYSAMFSQAGVEMGKPMDDAIHAFTNLSAAAQGTGIDVGRIMQQVAASGRIDAGVLNQLSDAGVNAAQYLSQTTGKSVAEVRKLASEGKISFEDLVGAINSGMGSYAQEMGETLPAKLGNLKTSLASFGASAIEPMIGPITTLVEMFTNGMKSLTPLVGQLDQYKGVLIGVGAAIGTFVLPALTLYLAAQAKAAALSVVGAIAKIAGAWRTMAGALRLSAIAQWAMNSALLANPITWIVVAVAALGVALWAFFTKTETGRQILEAAWNGIKNAISAVWNWISGTLWPGIKMVWDGIADGAVWLWQNAIVPAWNGIQTVIGVVWTIIKGYYSAWFAAFQMIGQVATWLWQNIIVPAFNGIRDAILIVTIPIQVGIALLIATFRLLAQVATWLWNNAIVPAFNGIKAAAQFMWSGVQTVFGWFQTGIRFLGQVVTWLWNNAAKPAFEGIKTAAEFMWSGVETVFGWFTAGLETVGDIALWLWNEVMVPAWNGIKGAIEAVWNFIRPILDKIGTAIQALGTIATQVGDAMRNAFSGVVNVLKAPIHMVGRLLASLPGSVMGVDIPGLSTLKSWGETMQSLRSGGVIAGRTRRGRLYGPGSGTDDALIGIDRVTGVPIVRVSAGEGIVTEQAMRNGGDEVVAALNAGTLPGLASGGVIAEPYGLPTGTNISYGSPGFPEWVTRLGLEHGVQPSTYPGHQESDRNEPGYAPNPQRLNRGIDWSGPVADMHKFAQYLLSIAPTSPGLEQIIWQNPSTGEKIGWAGREPDTSGAYFASDYSGHQDHVHIRASSAIGGPATPAVPDVVTEVPQYQSPDFGPDPGPDAASPDITGGSATTSPGATTSGSQARTWGEIAGMAVTEQLDDVADFFGIKDTWMYDPSKIGIEVSPGTDGQQPDEAPRSPDTATIDPSITPGSADDGTEELNRLNDIANTPIPRTQDDPTTVTPAAPGSVSMGEYQLGSDFYVREAVIAAAERGFDETGAAIGVATQLVEAGDPVKMWANRSDPESLQFPHDAVGSDHDSSGTFQQRNNGAWGTVAQRMNARGSASMFFNELAKKDWKTMDPGAAAQSVQRSAFPDRYGKQMPKALQLVRQAGVFDTGGILPDGGIAINTSGNDEYVLPPKLAKPIISPNAARIADIADPGNDTGRAGAGPLIENLTMQAVDVDDAVRKVFRETSRLAEADMLAGGRV